jgi:hypothetical protein
MKNKNNESFYIYTIGALRGMIYPEVVMVAVNLKNKKLFFRLFVDREPTDFDKEVMGFITTDIISNYNDIEDVDEKCVYFKKSKFNLINLLLKYIVFYKRMEKDQYSIYE